MACLVSTNMYCQLFNEEIIGTVELINEASINSIDRDFSPAFWNEELIFVHSGSSTAKLDNRIDEPYFDLKFAVKGLEGTYIKSAYLPKSINSPYHEGYKIQMDFYNFLLNKMGFKTSDTAYFLVVNANRNDTREKEIQNTLVNSVNN